MELVPILEEDTKEIVQESSDILSDAKALVIQDDDKFHFVNDLLKAIKGIRNKIDEYFDPAIKKTHAAWKENIAMKKKQSEPVEQAERIIKNKIAEYHTKRDQERMEEERRRQDILWKQEEERKLAEAIETGDETILDEPVIVPEVKIEDTTKHEGVSFSLIWKFRIINKEKVPEEYKIVDEKRVGQIVRANKAKTSIPGIEVYSEKSTRVRV